MGIEQAHLEASSPPCPASTNHRLDANLSGANLLEAKNLTKVQMKDVIVDGSTKLPSYLKEG
jgi:hypothetical protein